MVEAYSILFQKDSEGAKVKDLLTDWGMVCTDFPFDLYPETKDLPKRDWADEDGEDTFIPDVLPLKAYDLEAGICYKGCIRQNLFIFKLPDWRRRERCDIENT